MEGDARGIYLVNLALDPFLLLLLLP